LRKSKFTDSQLLAIFGEGEDGLVLAEMCTQIRKILDHIGVDSEPPHISPARGPPLWEDCSDEQTDDGVQTEPAWGVAAQPAPDYEVDQRINW